MDYNRIVSSSLKTSMVTGQRVKRLIKMENVKYIKKLKKIIKKLIQLQKNKKLTKIKRVKIKVKNRIVVKNKYFLKSCQI